jgi:WD40 repeat protein
VKVLDFGLAKAVWGTIENTDISQSHSASVLETVTGHIVGSPPYMSPEQARGEAVDALTDIWAFGCVLYELLTGRRAFQGQGLSETIAAVLERDPDWNALPRSTPPGIRDLLRRCLHKDATRRLQSIVDARTAIEDAQRGRNRWKTAAIAAAALATLAIVGSVWSRGQALPTNRSEWVQITRLPDSVSQPALSPDGRMVTFIRGPSTFFGPGQVYVKTLPDGEPVRLTNDDLVKMRPVFSPDGARIAYTVVAPKFLWDTWNVPVLGGDPERWLRNASGLVWAGPRQLLFSEIKNAPHMGIVASDDVRHQQRDVYLPEHEHAMAHLSYASPAGNSILLVEMDRDHAWLPCRLIAIDGSSPDRQVGPSGGACTSGAWSPDGEWMYVTSNAGGVNHIWRQRFPDGTPEQITSGPTAEEGIAMAPDGASFITAASLQNVSIWLHDARGERQISPLEGIADVESGGSVSLAPGFRARDYDISVDGLHIVMDATDPEGRRGLWLAPLDRQLAPRMIPNGEGGRQPKFGPDGEIFFRRAEAGVSNFVYRMRPDGSGTRKALEQSVALVFSLSRDGRWIVGWSSPPDSDGMATLAFPLSGGPPIILAPSATWEWAPGGNSVAVSGGLIPQDRSYLIPVTQGQAMPQMPLEGFRSEEEIARLPGVRKIDAIAVPGPSPDVYVFYRGTTQRNLYRVPLQ